jgi:hypothetical protein
MPTVNDFLAASPLEDRDRTSTGGGCRTGHAQDHLWQVRQHAGFHLSGPCPGEQARDEIVAGLGGYFNSEMGS